MTTLKHKKYHIGKLKGPNWDNPYYFHYDDVKQSILQDKKDFENMYSEIKNELLCCSSTHRNKLLNLLQTHYKLKKITFGEFEK